MGTRLFVLHTSSYLYLVLAYMAAQGAFSWLAPLVPGGRTALNLLFMALVPAGMLAFGFFHRRIFSRGRLPALLAANGAARAAMVLLPAGAAAASAALFLLTGGWMFGMAMHRAARRVPRERLGRFVGGSLALAGGLMFLLSFALGLSPAVSAASFGAAAWLLWKDWDCPEELPVTPGAETGRRLPLLAGVAVLLSLAFGINDSLAYLRFEEFRDVFGLSRLALCAGFFAAGRLADARRAYLPLAVLLSCAATMVFHAMALEGFPAAALFCANEFFWSFGLLFILLMFLEASLRTQRPELWASMGRIIEMPAEGLGAALGATLMVTLPTSAVLVAYTLTLAAAAGLLYWGMLSRAEETPTPPAMLPTAELATESAAMDEDMAEETEAPPDAPPPTESLAEAWRTRYALTNRETEILQASLSDETAAEIGKSLFITTSTVRFHLTHLLKKTGFASRKELVESFKRELAET